MGSGGAKPDHFESILALVADPKATEARVKALRDATTAKEEADARDAGLTKREAALTKATEEFSVHVDTVNKDLREKTIAADQALISANALKADYEGRMQKLRAIAA